MFDISQLVVIGAIVVPFWICVVIPLGIATLIFISIGKGIAYLFRRDLYERIDELYETSYQKDQLIKELRLESTTYQNTMRAQDRKIREMQDVHAKNLVRAKLNVGNTGIFANFPPLSVVAKLPAEASAKAPPPPPRRGPPPRPARQPRLQS